MECEYFTLFNGWKHIEEYSPYGEDNQQYASAGGMPAWYTLNLRRAVTIRRNIIAQVQAENLLDKNYRHFAGSISAPGRNFVFSLKITF